MREILPLLFVFVAATAPGPLLAGAPPELVGDWNIESIGQTPVLENSETILVFTEDGTLSANVGCNQAGGSYRLSASGLEIGPLAATRKMCEGEVMAQEDAFFSAIGQVSEYRAEGNVLHLLDGSGNILVTASR